MMNYIKSECYRITHTKELYLFTGILSALACLVQIVLKCTGTKYAVTSFSYSNLVANPMLFAAAGVMLSILLYEDSHKNGNLKNTVSCGISRVKIFAGECMISLAAATFAMAVTVAVWIFSAQLLLVQDGPVVYQDLLMETGAVYLIAAASMISALVFLDVFEKNILGIFVWAAVWFVIPKILYYLALRFHAFYPAAMWIPENFFGVNSLHVNMNECITIWDDVHGFVRCLLSGAAGVVIFLAAGVCAVRKKDL